MIYDVLIVGGGPAGLSAALMFGSSAQFVDEAKDKKILVVDAGHSDAKRARFFNAPGIEPGKDGTQVLQETQDQLTQYKNVDLIDGKVRELKKSDNVFDVTYFDSNQKKKISIKCEKVILATGFRSFGINGLEVEPEHFHKSENPTRVQFKHENFKIQENIYVAGLLSGDSSQWPIVTGSGAQVAINIISEWAGAWKVMHDKV